MRLANVPALMLLAALPVAAFALSARAETVPLTAIPQISVTGEGEVAAAPDLATITLGVTTEARTAAEALAANSAALAAVVANLKAAGIEPRDIQTTGLSLNPVWSGYSDRPQRIEKFQAVNGVTVRVRDIARTGAVLDAAVKDGANTLNGLSFGMADPRPLLDEARARAVADARRRAELLAAAAGVTLGRVLTIGEAGGYAPPAPMYRSDAMVAAAPPVEGGEVTIRAQVTVVWELLP